MSDPTHDDRDDLDEGGQPGPSERSDDETEADMGLSGGTGAVAGEGTEQPYGTEEQRGEDTDDDS